jgi:G3E family GTPase
MTDLIVLSGFLGAGKTTLLKHLLGVWKDAGARVAVVSNDFGPVNVDSGLISTDGPVVEITDGSMYCSCRGHDFVEGLRTVAGYAPDHVLVESSGLGDPANLGDLLAEVAGSWPELTYLGLVCVVDVEEALDLADLLPVVTRQISFADVILANKADLVGPERLREVVDWLSSRNPHAEVLPAVRCEVPVPQLLQALAGARPARHEETTNTCEARMDSAWLSSDAPVPEEALRRFLADLAPRTHRIKGVVRCADGTAQVSCVGRHIEIVRDAPARPTTGLVLLTSERGAFRSRIVASWDQHVRLPMRLS